MPNNLTPAPDPVLEKILNSNSCSASWMACLNHKSTGLFLKLNSGSGSCSGFS